jgi:hypothetical protein
LEFETYLEFGFWNLEFIKGYLSLRVRLTLMRKAGSRIVAARKETPGMNQSAIHPGYQTCSRYGSNNE